MNDDLDDRLRAGFQVLADEAGAAPPVPDLSAAVPVAHRTRRPMVLTAAAVIAVIAAIGVIAVRSADEPDRVSSADTADPNARPLVGTDWWLAEAEGAAGPIPIPTEGTPWYGLRFDASVDCDDERGECYGGPQIRGSDACNGFQRKMEVDGSTIRLGDHFGATTLLGCSDDLSDLMQAFFRADEFTYAIDGDSLVLRSASGSDVLTYRALDTPFGPTSSVVVDSGEVGPSSFRLVWSEGGLDFQVVETTTGEGGRGGSGVAADPGRINAMRGEVGGQPYLFGVVPAATSRFVYEPAGGEPQELDEHDVGDPDYAVIGGFVEGSAAQWDAVAYDAQGNELHRLRWG